MKFIFLNFLVCSLLLFSCNTETLEPVNQHPLSGKWLWESTSGGIAGITMKASSSDQKEMHFFDSGLFKFYTNGVLKTEANFTIVSKPSRLTLEVLPHLVYTDDKFMTMTYKIIAGKLYLSEEVNDGFGHIYVRK